MNRADVGHAADETATWLKSSSHLAHKPNEIKHMLKHPIAQHNVHIPVSWRDIPCGADLLLDQASFALRQRFRQVNVGYGEYCAN